MIPLWLPFAVLGVVCLRRKDKFGAGVFFFAALLFSGALA